jgi:hypothetical protein
MTLRKRVYCKLKAQALDHTLQRTPLEEAIDLSSDNMVIMNMMMMMINTHGENRIRITPSH